MNMTLISRRQPTLQNTQKCTKGMKGIKLLEEIPMRAVRGEGSMTLHYGKREAEKAGFFKRMIYTTWNSIPWRHSFSIAWELGKAMLRSMWSRELKIRALELRPNYPEFRFSVLENSFTRRSNGALNWIKDIAGGKPYRLVSDMEDGELLSPRGGSLVGIFPKTMLGMLRNPLTMGVLEAERIGLAADLINDYGEKFGNLEGLDMQGLLGALKYVGENNSVMFYRCGFRDSLLEMARKRMNEITGGRGSIGVEADRRVARLDSIIHELEQEVNAMNGILDSFRKQFHRISLELGKTMWNEGIIDWPLKIAFSTIYEVEKGIADATRRA